ncbi:MAG: glycosyltransferase family 4 protein [Planctomycetota bacterium]
MNLHVVVFALTTVVGLKAYVSDSDESRSLQLQGFVGRIRNSFLGQNSSRRVSNFEIFMSLLTQFAGPSAATLSQTSISLSAPTDLRRVLNLISGEHFTGAERVQQLLGRGLGRLGFDPIFACVNPGKFRRCSGLRDYQVRDFAMGANVDMNVVRDLIDFAQEESIELLHAHSPRTAMIASQISYRSGIPWVYHIHRSSIRNSPRSFSRRIQSFVESYAIRGCEMLMTVSRRLRREILASGWDRSKLCLVPNGVPTVQPIETSNRMQSKTWRVGLVGLMRPHAGVETALQAMKLLKQQGQPIELQLIGSFESVEYEEMLAQLEHKLDLRDMIKRTGFVSEVSEQIQQLDALMIPSQRGEGTPMVALEAIAAGVPVVGSDVAAVREVIRDGVEGLLAEPDDPAALAQRVMDLAASREQWAELSANAITRHRECFTDTAMNERVANCYDRVLDAQILQPQFPQQ